ncbi:MAG: DNA repair protein RecN [Archangium sp.]|nr:DNA repair protein RecN [Archangium sp.]MDP3155499.1 DNA repair protein RecN [Archangium sp.]MDP3573831.1 DNA repair protein RecN [Archangium sp.]
MLITLRLKNFAVVEEAEVGFGPGLTVLTGETGAGKSILIDALGLLVGGRAEPDVIRSGADEAVIEGLFERSEVLASRLNQLGLPDDGPEVSVRRAFGRQGRGRVHVNGALVTVGVLQRLMKAQIDIAGQHEHMALLDAGQHLGLVDRFGELLDAEVTTAYRSAWERLRDANARLQGLGGDESQVAGRIDFLTFQLEEIERVAPKPGEDLLLEVERKRLASSEKLRHGAGSAEELIATRDGSATELLGRAFQLVGEAEKLDPSLCAVREALWRTRAELEEASHSLSRYLSGLDSDPKRLEEVDDRLDAIRRLCRKHGATLDGVLNKRTALTAELDELVHRAERRAEVEVERVKAEAEATAAASQLTAARTSAAGKLTSTVMEGLERLAMGRARFEVQFEAAPLSGAGADAAQFFFSANPGEAVRPLAKVASGGEASRVMLAMKAALAGSDACVCSVFDEADAGIGGAVADVVGRLIKDISGHRQVLCITHLPQVAAHADAHLRIEKGEVKGRTRSVVQALEAGDDRTRELARMLSGVEITREALGAAEALLRSALRHVKPKRNRKKQVEVQRRSA